MTDELVAAEILAMRDRDQAMRRAAQAGSAAWDGAIDLANTDRLKHIVDRIGWPTRSRVGPQAEHAAWLLAQHADHDAAFQERCFALMRAEPADEVCPKHLAYLEDRINVHGGRPQRFGTQLRKDAAGELAPDTLADADACDALRASVGLEPLADYLARSR